MDKWLSHNNFAKVIALIFSVILWAMVHLDSGTPVPPTTSVPTKFIENVQIQMVGFDEDKYVLYVEPDKVNIEVRGKRTDITTNFTDYKVKLDLSHVKPGTMTLPLTTELPPGVQLVSMDPSYVNVTIEAKITKEVPVSIVTKGTLAAGLQMGSPVVAKEGLVKVTLPESEIEELDKVQGIVDITGLEETLKGKAVKLVAYNKQGQEMSHAEISPASIEVDIPINKLYKSVPLEVKATGQLPDGYILASIEKSVEGVALYGSKEALDGVDTHTVTVDLNQFEEGTEMKYTVNLTPPEGFEKIEPSTVSVTVKVEPVQQKLVNSIPITLLNMGEKFSAKFISPVEDKISLTVLGSEVHLAELKPGDITVTADLSNLGVGIHKIPLEVKLPRYIELADKSLYVEIELTDKSNPTVTVPVPEDPPEDTGNDETLPPPTEENPTEGSTNNNGG
ncbi:CdaR family protein [Paenibacillus sp. FSL K6-2524]|uniref:CdaR family protein n=1 Tax=Paenibacillus sp. FSL K6-2524 TaxID=2954516 RepID=UPI0030F78BE6